MSAIELLDGYVLDSSQSVGLHSEELVQFAEASEADKEAWNGMLAFGPFASKHGATAVTSYESEDPVVVYTFPKNQLTNQELQGKHLEAKKREDVTYGYSNSEAVVALSGLHLAPKRRGEAPKLTVHEVGIAATVHNAPTGLSETAVNTRHLRLVKPA